MSPMIDTLGMAEVVLSLQGGTGVWLDLGGPHEVLWRVVYQEGFLQATAPACRDPNTGDCVWVSYAVHDKGSGWISWVGTATDHADEITRAKVRELFPDHPISMVEIMLRRIHQMLVAPVVAAQ